VVVELIRELWLEILGTNELIPGIKRKKMNLIQNLKEL
jgi:hypothetical protein